MERRRIIQAEYFGGNADALTELAQADPAGQALLHRDFVAHYRGLPTYANDTYQSILPRAAGTLYNRYAVTRQPYVLRIVTTVSRHDPILRRALMRELGVYSHDPRRRALPANLWEDPMFNSVVWLGEGSTLSRLLAMPRGLHVTQDAVLFTHYLIVYRVTDEIEREWMIRNGAWGDAPLR